jgi:hypothetical protein
VKTGMAILLLLGTAHAWAQQVADLAWLAGDWVEDQGQTMTEEVWLPPRGGIMLMMNRSGTRERAAGFEFARIASIGGRLAFMAQPVGAAPVSFALQRLGEQDVTFANPAHDFPVSVRYWREGELLRAEIAGRDGKVARQWAFRRR